MADDRKAVEGAIDYAVVNATTEPLTRLGAAGYIQGVAKDYYAGNLQRTGSRLCARGWLIEKILDGGPSPDNLAAWFRFNTGITVTGAGVSQWSDQSGNSRHLKQTTDTNRPALQADGSILFDGSDNYLKCDAFTLNQPETVYLLFKQVTWTINEAIFDGNTANSGVMFQATTTPNVAIFAGAGGVSSDPDLATDTYGVMACVFNGASSRIQLNNNAAVNGNTGSGNMGGFTLGARGDNLVPSNIQVKEVILYSAAHDAATRKRNIRYLATVGGLSI